MDILNEIDIWLIGIEHNNKFKAVVACIKVHVIQSCACVPISTDNNIYTLGTSFYFTQSHTNGQTDVT